MDDYTIIFGDQFALVYPIHVVGACCAQLSAGDTAEQ